LISFPQHFAQAEDSGGGLGAFQLNIKDFVIQLVTFAMVLLVLKKWVIPKLVATMEKRQQALEQSLKDAQATQETLARAQKQAEEILSQARTQADQALAEAKGAGQDIVAKAEAAAAERADLIVKEAETRLNEEREKLRLELRGELAGLVADATERIVDEKLDQKKDMSLIERAIKGVTG